MSLFFFGINLYKNKDTFKIFSPQILEVYIIILVKTTLESIMFHYTFPVINTMFAPCTALLYDSTAATGTLKLSTTPLSISSGIHLISLLMMPSLICGLFSETVFQVLPPPQKIVRPFEILGIGWPGVIGLMQNESFSWEVTREVFKWFVREMRWRLISRTEHLNTSGITSHGTDSFCVKPITSGHPIPKTSTHVTIFWGGYLKERVCEKNPQTREDIIRREIRWIPQEMLNGIVDNFNVWVAAVLSYSNPLHGTNY